MSNYKFNIDPKEPSEDQIARNKDFGKVMQNYQRMTHPMYNTPLYRYRRIFISVLLVLSVVWMVVEFGETKDDKKKIPVDTVQPIKKDSVEFSPQTKMIEKETLKAKVKTGNPVSKKTEGTFILEPKPKEVKK